MLRDKRKRRELSCSLCKNESGIDVSLFSFFRLVFVVDIIKVATQAGSLTSDRAVFDKEMARAARRIRGMSDRKAGSCLCGCTGDPGGRLVAP